VETHVAVCGVITEREKSHLKNRKYQFVVCISYIFLSFICVLEMEIHYFTNDCYFLLVAVLYTASRVCTKSQ
jgi:hypothetical protein